VPPAATAPRGVSGARRRAAEIAASDGRASSRARVAIVSATGKKRKGTCYSLHQAWRNNRIYELFNMNSQSYVSDELTHFVGRAKPSNDERYRLLLEILRGGWLQASYREELGSGFTMLSDGEKRLSTNEAIKCTMLCFCDIPPEQLQLHMQKYGSFGIAFSKEALIHQGATPVHYVPRNARNRSIGIGPQTIAERFDELRMELQRVRFDLEGYVASIDGKPAFLSRLSPPSTPVGHRLLGRFSALQDEFEELVFARIKFFTAGLPEEHDDNYYMEREWRLPGGLAFRLGDIARIFLPQDYAQRFRVDVPDYTGVMTLC
jgi:hypothetical protein